MQMRKFPHPWHRTTIPLALFPTTPATPGTPFGQGPVPLCLGKITTPKCLLVF
jgi:hypothetical protein